MKVELTKRLNLMSYDGTPEIKEETTISILVNWRQSNVKICDVKSDNLNDFLINTS